MTGRQVVSCVPCDLMDFDEGKTHTHDGQGALWNAYVSALSLALHLRQAILIALGIVAFLVNVIATLGWKNVLSRVVPERWLEKKQPVLAKA